ncbi:hypothetical protein EN745_15905 [Mesorhizobium sp. M4A.F.Ca.ET.022.05.2.1]|nr:hypothetical protein EN745_15905 [Mesorhizobium sp. M4A.F.Ca.ET.022.05.2.1]
MAAGPGEWRVEHGRAKRVISPLEGEMAGRPEGVAPPEAPSLVVTKGGAGFPRATSVAFGYISPSRGEISDPPPHAAPAARSPRQCPDRSCRAS